jgi:hypothetical protein
LPCKPLTANASIGSPFNANNNDSESNAPAVGYCDLELQYRGRVDIHIEICTHLSLQHADTVRPIHSGCLATGAILPAQHRLLTRRASAPTQPHTPNRQLLLTRSERRFCFSMLASSSTRSACARLLAASLRFA